MWVGDFHWLIEKKSANKGLMLNKKSNHPEHIKHACVSNTIQTYTAICSNDGLLEEAEQTFNRRAIRNGYDSTYIDHVKARERVRHKPKEYLPTLTIPYVSSGFTNDNVIKRAVKRSNLNVRIVQRPQSSLKNILVLSSQDPTIRHAKIPPNVLFATTRLSP